MIDEIKEVCTNSVIQEESHKMTEEEYTKNRNEFSANIFKSILWVLLFALPLIIYIATFDIDDYNSEAHALFVGFISFVVATPCMFFFNLICENAFKLSDLKEEYRKTLPDEEIKVIKKRKKRACIAIWSVISAVVISAIAYAASLEIKASIKYNNAIELYRAGNYDEAIAEFESLNNRYDDIDDYLNLCVAYRHYYVYGNETGAYNSMKGVKFIYKISDEEWAEIEEFRALVTKLYEEELEYQERIEKLKLEKEEAKIKNGVPYIGMKESYISKTKLGKYRYSYRDDFEYGEGMRLIETTVYQFYDLKGNRIFDAYCKEGYVIKVEDHRSTPIKPYVPKYDLDDYDPYDIDRFSNAEDFYDDNWDYFMSYEDAEDYFNEHKNK